MIRFCHILLLFVLVKSAVYSQTTKGNTSQIKNNNGGHTTYTVSVSEGDSRCQILINGIPLMYYEGKGYRSFYANSAILSSGSQNLKIVTGGKTPIVTITETMNDPKEYSKKEIWKNEGSLQGSFMATVPYDISGWKHSRVVSDDKAAQTDALKWFERMAELLKNGKGAEFMNELLPAEKTAATLYNLTKQETTTFHTNWTNYISKKEYSLVPVSDCKIEAAGNGKLIHLVNNLHEGGFALKARNGQLLFMDIYLHIPEGKTKMEPVLANFKQLTSNFKKRDQ